MTDTPARVSSGSWRSRSLASPPQAAPDPLAVSVLILTVAALLWWRVVPLKAMLAGAVIGVVRTRFGEWPGRRAVPCAAPWAR